MTICSVTFSALADDGTATVKIHCEGKAVFDLLALDTAESNALLELAQRDGSIVFNQVDTDTDSTCSWLSIA